MSNLEFVQVPVSALMSIKDTSIKVYSIIYTNCKMNNNTFYHSYSQFAKDLGVNTQYVKRALKDLKNCGHIEIISGKGSKSPNTFHLTNRVKSEPIDDNNSIKSDTNNRVKSEPINRVKSVPQKEYIKENKKEYIDNNIVNMDYTNSTCSKEKVKKEINKNNGKLNRKVEIRNKQNNNNMIFFNDQMKVTNNSQPAVQSDDWTKDYNKENNAHSSMRIVQYGDSPKYLVQNEYDYSSILDTIPSATPSREKKHIQQVTPHTEQRDTHSPKPQENGTGGDNSSTMDNCTTPTLKTQQDANMDGHISIDELEMMYNGGQTIPNSSKSNNAHLADNSNNGGGRKFTNRKEWEIQMRVALQHIGNSSDLKNKLTGDDLKIITEGTNDKYRVIDTLKAIQQMLTYRVKFKGYDVWLNNAIDTMEANEDVYTPKQYDYACELYDDCVDRYMNIINDK